MTYHRGATCPHDGLGCTANPYCEQAGVGMIGLCHKARLAHALNPDVFYPQYKRGWYEASHSTGQ